MLLIDPDSDSASAKADRKFIDTDGLIEWLDDHQIDVMRYLDNRFSREVDKDACVMKFANNPQLGYLLVKDAMMSESAKLNKVMKYLQDNACVIPVLGKKGGGKTTLAGTLSDLMYSRNMNICWFNVNYSDELPDYIKLVNSWSEVPDSSLVVVDEAGLTANNKEFMTKESREMSKLLYISRHHDLRILFNYQSMHIIQADIFKMADAFLVKPLQFTDVAVEDDRRNMTIFKYLVQMQPRSKAQCLFTNGEEWFTFSHRKPVWWTEGISKGFSRRTISQAVEILAKAHNQGASMRMLVSKAKSMGYDWDEYEMKLLLENPKKFAKAYTEDIQ